MLWAAPMLYLVMTNHVMCNRCTVAVQAMQTPSLPFVRLMQTVQIAAYQTKQGEFHNFECAAAAAAVSCMRTGGSQMSCAANAQLATQLIYNLI